MAAAKAQANVLDDYEYMDEKSIDPELKCALCIQPLQVPLSATCGHTFCQACIRPWIARQSTCPTCRSRTSTEEFRPISTRIVLNQLERILVQCKRCNQANIQRGNIDEHEKRCPNQMVSCPSFDIKCTWKGTRNALTEHIRECPFQKIRPAINDIYEHLKNIYEPLVDELQTVRQQLEKQMQRNNEQNRFLLAVFNKGKPMSDRCSGQCRNCQLQQNIQMKVRNPWGGVAFRSPAQNQQHSSLFNQMGTPQSQRFAKPFGLAEDQSTRNPPTNNQFNCTNCQNGVDPNDILLHHCEGGGVCRTCVEKYGSLESYEKIFPDIP